jgi:hypothetical protein
MASRRDGYEAWERLAGRDRSGEGALEALSDIGELRRLLERAELDAVRDARGAGKSWTEIAVQLGITRQSAWERWRELDSKRPDAVQTASEPTGDATVPVPDVVGLLWPPARAMLHECGLVAEAYPSARRELSDPEMTDYLVISQRPKRGRSVARGSTVKVFLASDPGDAGVHAPLTPPPNPHTGPGVIDPTIGDSIREARRV